MKVYIAVVEEQRIGSVGRRYFISLKEDFNYSIEDWVTSTSQTKLDQSDTEWAQNVRIRRNDLWEQHLDQKIELMQVESVKFSIFLEITCLRMSFC